MFSGKSQQGVSTINLIFYVDFAIFAVFAVLLITELMGSVLLLIAYDAAKKKVLEHIVPIWEVTGTFGAFWVVVSDFAFPNILLPLAHIFAVGLMLFLILIIARNSTIVFAEYIMKKGWLDERKLYRMYAVSTVFLSLIVLTILAAIISGTGVNLAAGTFSVTVWITSAGSILFIIGAVAIGLGLAPVFYGIDAFRFLTIPAATVGVILSVLGYFLYSPSLITPYIAIPVILTILVPVLNRLKAGAKLAQNKLFFVVFASVILFTLNTVVYPSAFGRALPVDSITTVGPMSQAFLLITLIGCALLGVMIAFYLLAVRRDYAFRQEIVKQ